MGLYSRHVFPHLMEWGLSAGPVMELRIKALEPSSGRVLEIGFGTGLNLACYPGTVDELIAIDSELMMAGRVRERISKSRFPVRREMLDASKILPFQDSSFDTVVTTFTVCSIKDISSALLEIRRVLKPGGYYLFLEHGRSDDHRIARFQDWLNPIQNVIAAGCNLNRRIDRLIGEAGLEIRQLDRPIIPKTPRVFAQVYSGIATAPVNAKTSTTSLQRRRERGENADKNRIPPHTFFGRGNFLPESPPFVWSPGSARTSGSFAFMAGYARIYA